jgi:hypothetical protein
VKLHSVPTTPPDLPDKQGLKYQILNVIAAARIPESLTDAKY